MSNADGPISFFVPGLPRPAGSKRAFVLPGKDGARPRAIVTDDCRTSKDWKAEVKAHAIAARDGRLDRTLPGAIAVEPEFFLPRPKAHYRPNGELKAGVRQYQNVRPDVDKLSRAVLDAMTGVIWRDDGQVAHKVATKRYAEDMTGVQISVEVLEA